VELPPEKKESSSLIHELKLNETDDSFSNTKEREIFKKILEIFKEAFPDGDEPTELVLAQRLFNKWIRIFYSFSDTSSKHISSALILSTPNNFISHIDYFFVNQKKNQRKRYRFHIFKQFHFIYEAR